MKQASNEAQVSASFRPTAHPLVVVMGVSGAGKSVVGQALATRLGLPYADGDDFHTPEHVAQMRGGTALSDADRAPWLLLIGKWLAARQSSGAVVSCSALRRVYRDVLVGAAPGVVFCHLTVDPAVLAQRVAARREHFMPGSLLASQLSTLEPLQPDERAIVLPVGSETPAQLAERFASLLTQPQDSARSTGNNDR